jgi:hypothetical protein
LLTPSLERRRRPSFGHVVQPLTLSLCERLRRARSYPSVSIFMTTAPGKLLAPADVVRLDRLVLTGARRLAAESATLDFDRVVRRLRRVTLDARHQGASRGLAAFASAREAFLVHLPIPVADRVVIDPRFATCDLLRALARTA